MMKLIYETQFNMMKLHSMLRSSTQSNMKKLNVKKHSEARYEVNSEAQYETHSEA